MKKSVLSLGIIVALLSPTIFGQPINTSYGLERQPISFGYTSQWNDRGFLPSPNGHGAHQEEPVNTPAQSDSTVFAKSLVLSTCVGLTGMATWSTFDNSPTIFGLLVGAWALSRVSRALTNSMDVPEPKQYYRSRQWDGIVIGTALSTLAGCLWIKARQA